MNHSVVVIDNHSDYHGQYVTECVQKHWNGEIKKLNLGASSVSMSEIVELLNEAADNVENWNVIALNLSFGGGLTNDPDDSPEEVSKAVRRLYRKGVTITFSAGNNGWGMLVSKLSSHPLVFSVGALSDEGEIAYYSNRHPRLVSMFADGHYNERNIQGTSFSSPLLCGALATLRTRLGIDDLQARTILKNVSNLYTRVKESEFGGYATYYTLNSDAMENTNNADINAKTLITAIYEALAGRSPDESGFNYWYGRVKNGEDIEEILQHIVWDLKWYNDWMQDRCTVVPRLQSLYHLLLNREADKDGIMHYVKKLQGIDNNNGTFSTSDDSPENWKELIQLFAASINSENLHRRWILDLL